MAVVEHENEVECDVCQRRAVFSEVDRWLRLQTLAGGASLQRMREAAAEGVARHFDADLCSLECLSTWVKNAIATRDLEAGL